MTLRVSPTAITIRTRAWSDCHQADVLEEGQDIHLVFEGTGFLRYQVRMMTAVLEAAGRGKLTPEDINRMLAQRDKHASRYNAPAHGLFLSRVWY